MRLIYNHQFGTGTQELVATAIRLDEISGNNHIGIAFKQRLAQAAVSFELRCGAGKHQFGIEVKLVLQLGLPLFRELWWAEDCQARYLAPVDQFARNQTGFDGLADAHVIGDQQAHRIKLERHE